ncbi:phage antirepressor KilAC domain-containing protein [Vreelandella venusta]|uniref:phage antirepressor KilAC domain-containing protein n=1 Tax=Vreelandella venusta TaxID=44935 RepID=UPI00200EFE5F|nr:phage antirepressor KilAC domain-containing protein [Halomonas venusta]UQI42766.1 phage antirepressor KilAC domain-containing protein [Halomonas venusta]
MNTNTSLIPIASSVIGGETVDAVDARELHAFLKVKRDFSSWVKARIAEYEFVEDVDYILLPKTGEAQPRGFAANRKEYAITIDMAKELSMVERNEKGREARQYFIECERRAKGVSHDPMQALSDPATMRELLLGYSEKVLALESAVQEQAPKVAALDRLSTSDGSLCLTDSAKHLQARPKDLMQWMQANTWIYRRAGAGKWLGYQHRIQQGLLEHKVTTVSRSDGSEKICEQVRVTPKGLSRLAEIFKHEPA